jgi:1,4-dihydroxy-2-naphthoate octaprenyltransferase
MGNGLAILFGDGYLMPNKFHCENWWIFGLTLLTTLLLQILSNFANDYGDAKKGTDNEDRIGPERAIQSGAISQKAMVYAIIVTSLLTLASGIILLFYAFGTKIDIIFISFLIIGVLAIGAAIKYTVGKGAYGYAGLGDLFVFIFFGLVGVIGSFYLQSHRLGWELLLPATTIGCFSVAVLNLNNMRDIVNDKAVGKNTLVVKIGASKSKIYHYTLFIVAYLVFPLPLVIIGVSNPIIWAFMVPTLIIHVIHLRKVARTTDPKDFDPELKKVALSTFLFSLLFLLTSVWIHS